MPVIEGACAGRGRSHINRHFQKRGGGQCASGGRQHHQRCDRPGEGPGAHLLPPHRRCSSLCTHERALRGICSRIRYEDLVGEIASFLEAQIAAAESRGLPREFTIVDPGFGFAKTPAHNTRGAAPPGQFAAAGRPLLIGTSRKSSSRRGARRRWRKERLEATAATVAIAIANGANIVRVHDVPEMVRRRGRPMQ